MVMKVQITVKLEFECTKTELREVHYDLCECFDEVMAREEPMFGNEECKDEMRLTEWIIREVEEIK